MLPCLATSLLALAAFHAPSIPKTPASHAPFGASPATLRNSAVRPRNSPLVAVAEAPTYGADVPYAEAAYDAAAAATFFRARPLATIGRLAQIALLSGGFVASLVVDKALKREEDPALVELRSQQLLELVTKLGPTFIKIGQALSIRSDLVPAAYVAGLAQLQDAVPPFDGAQGRAIIEAELGLRRIEDAFSSLSLDPVASASIGQVYRGTLRDGGGDVAVKVQRPNVLYSVALDLFVLREVLVPLYLRLNPESNTDATRLVDAYADGFVNELDYRREAAATTEFAAAMTSRGLGSVTAPEVVDRLSSTHVLTTKWVEGERLAASGADDVPRLCGVALNAYLTMLLDTGTLHCDPHPGNLLRTTDGKLCILDWGMTLAVPPDLQYALLEFIAHLNVEDYESVPQDFVNMGFSPEGVDADRLKRSGITDGLSFAFRQLSAGGGPKKIAERVEVELKERYGTELSGRELEKKAQEEFVSMAEAQLAAEGVDVKGVTNVMEEMSRRNRELFALPPWVLYVARAFSTLEGIGLSIDEDYAIVQECYPYLARRLFTDRSPRAKTALRAMLGLDGVVAPTASAGGTMDGLLPALPAAGGAMDGVVVPTGAAAGGGLSPAKLVEMSEQFRTATAATADVDAGAGQAEAARELAKLLVAPEGSTLQDILVDESAKLGDATVRSALRAALIDAPSTLAAPLGLAPPAALAQLLAPSKDDEAILARAAELRDLVAPQGLEALVRDGIDGASPPQPAAVAESVSSLLSDEAARDDAIQGIEGLGVLTRRVGAEMLRRSATRFDAASELPAAARDAARDANVALAEALDPPAAD